VQLDDFSWFGLVFASGKSGWVVVFSGEFVLSASITVISVRQYGHAL